MIPNRPIRFRRGSRAAIENRLLQSGEPYLAEDTDEVFIGGENKNIKLVSEGGSVELPKLETDNKELTGAINEINTKVDEHLEQKISELLFLTRNIELSGNQIITFSKKPKAIIIECAVDSKSMTSKAFYDGLSWSCIGRGETALEYVNDLNSENVIVLRKDTFQGVIASFVSLVNNILTINWNRIGEAPPTGDVYIRILAIYHGGED